MQIAASGLSGGGMLLVLRAMRRGADEPSNDRQQLVETARRLI